MTRKLADHLGVSNMQSPKFTEKIIGEIFQKKSEDENIYIYLFACMHACYLHACMLHFSSV